MKDHNDATNNAENKNRGIVRINKHHSDKGNLNIEEQYLEDFEIEQLKAILIINNFKQINRDN